jgi:outer membrane scaffolding protein for murein synthesis (MipA/OmpV family)
MVTRRSQFRALAALVTYGVLASAASTAADTPQKPLWEFGLGIGALAFDDYRGADTGHVYPLPVPYFDYRGHIFRADRDGARGVLFNREVAELNVSVSATTPVRSSATTARSGMPNLKPTVELGPSLDLHLWKSADRRVRLDLRMPVRAALTIESSPRAIGWNFAPRLNLDLVDVAGHPGWKLGVLTGPLFADRRYHEYFYGVAPQFATADRPMYEAPGGYAGSQALAALSKRFPRYWVGAFVRYDWLRGAVFAPSPLVRSQSYWLAGVGIAWMIGQSSRMVDPGDERL